MKKLIQLAIFLLLAFDATGVVLAAPFITSDPDPTGAADKCFYQEGTAAAVGSSLVASSCKIDLAPFTAGTHNLQVWFSSSLWGGDFRESPFRILKTDCERYRAYKPSARTLTYCD